MNAHSLAVRGWARIKFGYVMSCTSDVTRCDKDCSSDSSELRATHRTKNAHQQDREHKHRQ
jgi:hypothetical protein